MQLKSYRRRMGLKIGRLMIKSGGLASLLLDILRQLKYQVFLAIFWQYLRILFSSFWGRRFSKLLCEIFNIQTIFAIFGPPFEQTLITLT